MFSLETAYYELQIFLVLSMIGLELEGFCVFIGYTKKNRQKKLFSFLNYFILIGSSLTFLILFILGIDNQSISLLLLAFLGVICEFLLLFGKFNKFAVIFRHIPSNTVHM